MAKKHTGRTAEEINAWNEAAQARYVLAKEAFSEMNVQLDGSVSTDELARTITGAYKHVRVMVSFSDGEKKLVVEPAALQPLGFNWEGHDARLPEQREYPSPEIVQAFIYGYIRARRAASEEERARDRKRERDCYPFHPMMLHPFFGPRF